MKIEARGWDRNMGWNTLCASSIQAAKEDVRFCLDKITLSKQNNGIFINWGAVLKFNGKYCVRTSLTKEDIAKLFVFAYSDCSFEEVLRALKPFIESNNN